MATVESACIAICHELLSVIHTFKPFIKWHPKGAAVTQSVLKVTDRIWFNSHCTHRSHWWQQEGHPAKSAPICQ